MPTASKLVAALFFAVLGWFTADLVKPYLPAEMRVTWFSPVTALFGLVAGWRFMGPRAGRGFQASLGIGLSSAVLMVLWVTLSFAGYDMIMNSLRKSYDNPVEALLAMMGIGVDYLGIAAKPEVVAVLVIGGFLGGWLTEMVARRWR